MFSLIFIELFFCLPSLLPFPSSLRSLGDARERVEMPHARLHRTGSRQQQPQHAQEVLPSTSSALQPAPGAQDLFWSCSPHAGRCSKQDGQGRDDPKTRNNMGKQRWGRDFWLGDREEQCFQAQRWTTRGGGSRRRHMEPGDRWHLVMFACVALCRVSGNCHNIWAEISPQYKWAGSLGCCRTSAQLWAGGDRLVLWDQ